MLLDNGLDNASNSLRNYSPQRLGQHATFTHCVLER